MGNFRQKNQLRKFHYTGLFPKIMVKKVQCNGILLYSNQWLKEYLYTEDINVKIKKTVLVELSDLNFPTAEKNNIGEIVTN